MIKTKERLLEVKNNKEYQAMLKEIETAEVMTRAMSKPKSLHSLEEMDKLSILVKKDEETLNAGNEQNTKRKRS